MPFHISCRAGDADKHELDVNNLLFHKGKLYSAGDDGKIKVWTQDLTLEAQVQAHPCSVYCLAASDDTLYSCSNEGTVKAWDLSTLKEKSTLLKDTDTEFWVVRYSEGVLYSGDDQGNITIHKGEKTFGFINVAEPVKDLVVSKNLLFSGKDNDIVITDLHLGSDKPQFGVKKTIMGRAPIAVVDDKVIFTSRDGKDLIVHSTTGHCDEIGQTKGAHELIINALSGVDWDGKTTILFSGGWDKVVKQWKVGNDGLTAEDSADVDIVVNALAAGEAGQIYAAGGDGHIVRVEV